MYKHITRHSFARSTELHHWFVLAPSMCLQICIGQHQTAGYGNFSSYCCIDQQHEHCAPEPSDDFMQNLVFYRRSEGLLCMRKRVTIRKRAWTILTRLHSLKGLHAILNVLFRHMKLIKVIKHIIQLL